MMLKKIFVLILLIFSVQVILSQDQNAPTNLEVEIATLGGVQFHGIILQHSLEKLLLSQIKVI